MSEDSIHAVHTLCKWCILSLTIFLTRERRLITPTAVYVDGDKLKELRRQRVLSIREVSERSGVHRNVISKLENNRGGAYPESIRRIADVLGVEPFELLK